VETAAPVETTEPRETEAPAPEFRFTRANFPRLDGSTACLPMAEAVCSVLLGESRDQVQDLIHFNRTTQSFRNLMAGECDLLLAGQPNAAVFEEMETQGFAYDMEQLGTDALIEKMNQLVAFKGMTVEAYDESGAAFAYKNAEEKTDDLYFKVSKDGQTYEFTVEFYLCGQDTEVYKAVEALNVGDVIDLQGYLYWYNGANPHIIAVTKAA
jgi:hypothetical protein